ncbi:flagellar hook-length control protein FliK [Chelativorans sp. AA-79]|uniref:flagellar hook-length control protein FliK n=1 Tax=Chelativorans sp. AA-79 TaxID=3028735 RepID=UPI0023F7F173|nr:flagellar hook-length control protein FliK [Chelativorans sp. AA-79]WEX08320.1 flagellar hook-length control protein FliK [Chelativorans sp. AA-79]
MTGSIRLNLPAALLGSHGQGRGLRNAPAEEIAFGSALQESGPNAPVPEKVRPPLTREQDGWRVARGLMEIPADWREGPAGEGDRPAGGEEAAELSAAWITLADAAAAEQRLPRGGAGSSGDTVAAQVPPRTMESRAVARESRPVLAGSRLAQATSTAPGEMAPLPREGAPARTEGSGFRLERAELSLGPTASRTPAHSAAEENRPLSERPSAKPEAVPPQIRVLGVQTVPLPQGQPPSGSPAAAVLTAFQTDPGFSPAVAEAALATARNGSAAGEPLHTLKLQLQPVELGTVTARLSLSGDQLLVELQVETAEARHKLQADGDAMREALRTLGYDVDRIVIQQAPAGSSASTPGAPSARDPGAQNGPGQGHQGGGQSDPRQGGGGRGETGTGKRPEARQTDAAGNGLYI